MIIEFSVQNFRSIYDKVTLSMLASKLSSKEATLDNVFYHENYPNLPLLKSAVIYGANASGKSNLLKSLVLFKDFIINSTSNKFGDKLPYEPFRLLTKATKEPICLEMDFIAWDNIRYVYGFKIDEYEVLEEYLSAFNSRKETKLFVRRKGERIQFSSSFKGEKKILEEQLLKNTLLLSKAANNNYEQMQVVYSYFTNAISIIPFDNNPITTSFLAYTDSKFRKYLTDFLKAADTGIEGVEVERDILQRYSSNELDNMPWNYTTNYRINVAHKSIDNSNSEKIFWSLSEESEGTQKIYHIVAPVIETLNTGGILIIDEISSSLHPDIVGRLIIELFNNKKTNPKNAQLIFTTHDVSLLTSELFRRDQIWFTEKNNKGMTELYSLGSFDKKEVRKDIPFDKWYLSGRFGALPNIQEFNIKPE